MKYRIIIIGLLFFSLTSCLKAQTEGVTVLQADNFEKEIQNNNVQLLDVRTPDEFAEGHLPNAININVLGSDFDIETAKLDKEMPVMVYCKSGFRSAKAAANLKAQGFKSISELDGGFVNWQKAGKAIEN